MFRLFKFPSFSIILALPSKLLLLYMDSERRVTRSARVDIPYQPLPRRREPPRKKSKATDKLLETNASKSVGTSESVEENSRSELNTPNADNRPLSAVDSGRLEESHSAVVHKPPRPLPQRKSRAMPASLEDIDGMLISARAGYRDLLSPNHPSASAEAGHSSRITKSSIPQPALTQAVQLPPNREHRVAPSPPNDSGGRTSPMIATATPGSASSGPSDVAPGKALSNQPLDNDDPTPPPNTTNAFSHPDQITYVTQRGFTVQVPKSIRRREQTPGPDDREDFGDEGLGGNSDEERDIGQDKERDPFREQDPEDASSGSDFEDAEAERQRRHRYKSGLCRPVTPTIEEQDEDDDRDFENAPRTPSLSPPRIPASKKGKGRVVNPNPNRPIEELEHGANPELDDDRDDGAPNESDGDNEDEDGTQYSSGPIPETSKKKAYAAHQRFMDELKEIARECNKPVKHFRAMVGVDSRPTRRMSAWQAFQKWYPAAVEAKPKDVSPAVWAKQVSREYRKEKEKLIQAIDNDKPTSAQLEEHFKEQFDFVRNTVENYLSDKHNSKTFSGVISRVIEPFIRMSMNVAEEFGIHIFGFAVETSPESCSSVAWGGSAEYRHLRETNKTVIQTQLHDYEGLFKIAEMRERGLSSLKSLVNLSRKPGENERDQYCRVLGEFLRSDLARIYSERENSPQDESKHKMNWSWTDFAFKGQLRLVGWAKNAPYPKDQFLAKTLKQAPLKSMVKPRMTHLERSRQGDDSSDIDDELGPEIVHIESWTEDEMAKSLKQQRSIPLVVDVNGTTLSTVFDSKKYIACLRNTGQNITSATVHDHVDSVSEGEETDPDRVSTARSKRKTQHRGKKRARDDPGSPQQVEDDEQSTSRRRPHPAAPTQYIQVDTSDAEEDQRHDVSAPQPKRQHVTKSIPATSVASAGNSPLHDTSNSHHLPPAPSDQRLASASGSRVKALPTTLRSIPPDNGSSRPNNPAQPPSREAFVRPSNPQSIHEDEINPGRLYNAHRHPSDFYRQNPPPPDDRYYPRGPPVSERASWDHHTRGSGLTPSDLNCYGPFAPPLRQGAEHSEQTRSLNHIEENPRYHDPENGDEDSRIAKRRRIGDPTSSHGDRPPVASGSRHAGSWDENCPPYPPWPPSQQYYSHHPPYDSQRPHPHHFEDHRGHYHENSRPPRSPYRGSYY